MPIMAICVHTLSIAPSLVFASPRDTSASKSATPNIRAFMGSVKCHSNVRIANRLCVRTFSPRGQKIEIR